MIRALLVDDEAHARRGLRTLLAQDPEIEVVGECGTGEEAVRAINKGAPDLVLLDIDMPLGDGFGVLEQIDPDRSPFVIFVTAHDTFALKAFEVRALDYLLKPFGDARFFAAIDHAKEQIRTRDSADFRHRVAELLRGGTESAPQESARTTVTPLRRLAIRLRDRTLYVPVDTIDWIEGAGYRVHLHAGAETRTVRGNIGSFERRLAGTPLVRVHRSALVNVRIPPAPSRITRSMGLSISL